LVWPLPRLHQHDPRRFDPAKHPAQVGELRLSFQVQQRIVGLAYDADF
jgi:hypothetical protein